MISFDEIGLNSKILQAIQEMGFQHPTPIQEKTIPVLLESNDDIVALAQTGTGKTAAFGLPLIQLVDTGNKNVQALILCPTRELCVQITRDLINYAKHSKEFRITPVYGGANIVPQLEALKKGTHIVVGTPGRVQDLIKRKALKIGSLRWMVLDEADEMLTMGFKDELDFILSKTPPERQTLLFSATMPNDIARIAKKYMQTPVEITAGKKM